MLFKNKFTRELRLEKYWDDYEALEKYRLVEYEFKNGKLENDAYYYRASGDKKWAEKIARHYKLSIKDPLIKN